MGEYEDLKQRVDALEYKEVKPLKETVNDLRVQMNTNDILTKQSIESNEKLSIVLDNVKEAMDGVKETMRDISQGLKDENSIVSDLTETVSDLNTKVNSTNDEMNARFDKVNERVNQLDDKGKIDWQLWVKNHFIEILLSVGVVIYAIEQFIE